MSDNNSPRLSALLLKPITSTPSVLPPLDRLKKAIDRILDRSDAMHGPVADTEKVFAQMLERITSGQWRRTPLTLVTRAAGLSFAREHRDRPDVAPIQRFLLDEIFASTRSGFLNPMVRVYIETFTPHGAHTKSLANALAAVANRLGTQWQDLLKRLPNFFDPESAPKEIGARMAIMDAPWSGLRELGFRNPHTPGLLDTAHLSYLSAIAPKLNEQREVERLLGWLKPSGGQIRVNGAAESINAILRPWLRQDPPEELKKLILDGITRTYGHPKVDRKSTWNSVDALCEALFARWLIGADLEFMLEVLTEANEGHMWEPRHDFWLTLHRQGRIKDAWVAFNDVGHAIAQRKFRDIADPGQRRFGRQISKSGDDHLKSLLIMQVDDKIIVEGTWSFKVHIWSDASRAPKLHKQMYSAEEIRNTLGSEAKSHQGNRWKSWVYERI